jgi:hypothetical protein
VCQNSNTSTSTKAVVKLSNSSMTASSVEDVESFVDDDETTFLGDGDEYVSLPDERPTSYVFAHHHTAPARTTDPPLLIVLSPTKRGWASRSTSRCYFNHDYVSHETFEQVYQWLKLECKRPFFTQDREEALEVLAAPSLSLGGCLKTGCIECDPMMGLEERADRVLQHLEL